MELCSRLDSKQKEAIAVEGKGTAESDDEVYFKTIRRCSGHREAKNPNKSKNIKKKKKETRLD